MAYEALVPELSWLLTLLSLTLLVLIIAMCVCSKQGEKADFQKRSHEYGTAGRLSMTRESPIFQHQVSNGNAVSAKVGDDDSLDEDSSLKRNSWTVKDRALPDIPQGNEEIAEASIESVDAGSSNQIKKKKVLPKHSVPLQPTAELSASQLPCKSSTSQEQSHIMTITVNDKILDKSKPSNSCSWTDSDSILGMPDGFVVLKKIGNVSAGDSNPTIPESDPYNFESTSNPYSEPILEASSSPLCIRIGTAENGTALTPAGLAVAGAIPSSDIPYMTPPLLHNSVPEANEESPQRTGRSELPYTVISVREPLARVREMTMRNKRTTPQNSLEGENHYAMVPEEEQMYAEIGSGQDSGSSSITYAHIEPRELPPVPPTVESLKSVAHAHSRQASTVSNSSVGSCISGSIENSSPTQLRKSSACLYSTVDKNPKQRRTIHIAEGASAATTAEKHKKVEDLYAKVRKKRVDLTLSAGNQEYSGYQGIRGEDPVGMTHPPSPWASTTPPAPPPITGRLQAASLGMLSSGPSQHVRRHSADPKLGDRIRELDTADTTHFSYPSTNNSKNEPGYEQIYNDSCYEKIKEEFIGRNGIKDDYESIHKSSGKDSNFAGYACVKEKELSDPGYECVSQMENGSDPGYEPVRIIKNFNESDSNHGYTTVNLDDQTEPNYETVNKLYRSGSDVVDPGYEKVKKLRRNDSDATDPGYERVHNKNEDLADPGYETVNRSDSDAEPGYEMVRKKMTNKLSSPLGKERSEPSRENSTRASNSTVLYISGNSSSTNKDSTSKKTDDISVELDVNATFL